MGVYPQSITMNLKKAFNLPDRRGALVSDVVAESPAARSGLQTGDVILEFDGHSIKRADDLMWLVATTPSGKRVPMTMYRKGVSSHIEVTLQAAPEEPEHMPTPKQPGVHKSPLGMTVSEISPGIARELGNPQLRGVVVMSVEPDSPAVEAGIERGDIIVRVGEVTVSGLDDYAHAVRGTPHGEMLRLLVKRDGKNTWFAFQKR
jgi:serine protease Do